MKIKNIRIGTRNSILARTQSGLIMEKIKDLGYEAELVNITTQADIDKTKPIQEFGVGVFTSALRQELMDGNIDIAVHSYKDLPTAEHPETIIAAVPQRIDNRDALIAKDGLVLGMLPAGSKIGTSAPRRIHQINALGLGLEVVPIRGNLDTRIEMVKSGKLDAVVVALAGLKRLGKANEATELFAPIQIMPAPAQGALAVECIRSNSQLVEILKELDHIPSRITVAAERFVLATLEAGCSAPVGATASIVESIDDDGNITEELSVQAIICNLAQAGDGTITTQVIRSSTVGSIEQPELLGKKVALDLLDQQLIHNS